MQTSPSRRSLQDTSEHKPSSSRAGATQIFSDARQQRRFGFKIWRADHIAGDVLKPFEKTPNLRLENPPDAELLRIKRTNGADPGAVAEREAAHRAECGRQLLDTAEVGLEQVMESGIGRCGHEARPVGFELEKAIAAGVLDDGPSRWHERNLRCQRATCRPRLTSQEPLTMNHRCFPWAQLPWFMVDGCL